MMRCPTCGTEWTQKSQTALFLAGLVMIAGAVIFLFYFMILWIVSLMLLAVAAYLLVWSTRGKGLWCPQCKNFPVYKKR